MTMRSKSRTSWVVVFSIQFLRRPASLAASLAMHRLVYALRLDPFCCRESWRCKRRFRWASPGEVAGRRS